MSSDTEPEEDEKISANDEAASDDAASDEAARDEAARDEAGPSREKRKKKKVTRADRRQKRRQEQKYLNWRVAGITLLMGVALGGLALWLGPGLWEQAKSEWAGRKARQAVAHYEKGDMAGARAKIQRALSLDRDNPEVLRAVVEVFEELSPIRSGAFLARLVETGGGTPEEELELARFYVTRGYHHEGEQLIVRLLEQRPDDPSVLLLASRLEEARARVDQQISYLRKAIEIEPENREIKLDYARAQTKSPLGDVQDVGWGMISTLAGGQDSAGLAALHLIRTGGSDQLSLSERYLDLFKEHPLRDAETESGLEELDWEMRIYPAQAPELGAAAIDEWTSGEAGMEGLDLARRMRWLNNKGLQEQVVEYLMNAEEIEDASVLLVCFEACVESGDVERGRELLKRIWENGSRGMATLGMAALALDEGKPVEEVDKLFRGATDVAMEDGEHELVLKGAHLAILLGRYDEAHYALYQVFEKFPANAAEGLVMLESARGNTAEELKHLKVLAEMNADDRRVAWRTAYTQALLGVEMEDALATAERLMAHSAWDDRYRLLMAFCQYRGGQLRAAAETCEGVLPELVSPGERAVMAAILHAAGETARAQSVFNNVGSPEALKAEERALLKELQESSAAADP